MRRKPAWIRAKETYREGNTTVSRCEPRFEYASKYWLHAVPSERKIDRWHAAGFSWVTRGSDRSKLRSLHGEERVAIWSRNIASCGFRYCVVHCIVTLQATRIGEFCVGAIRCIETQSWGLVVCQMSLKDNLDNRRVRGDATFVASRTLYIAFLLKRTRIYVSRFSAVVTQASFATEAFSDPSRRRKQELGESFRLAAHD